jgi:hypothetical protein
MVCAASHDEVTAKTASAKEQGSEGKCLGFAEPAKYHINGVKHCGSVFSPNIN